MMKARRLLNSITAILIVMLVTLVFFASYLHFSNELYRSRYYAGDETYYLYK